MQNSYYVKKKLELIPVIIAGLKATNEFLELALLYGAENSWKHDAILENYVETQTNNEIFIEKLNLIYSDSEKEFELLKNN